MTGCCPDPPSISVGASADEDFPAQDTAIRPGESVDCYARRAGNSTGLMDDKTEYDPDKIANTDVPLDRSAGVSMQFRLTPNSTRTATSWTVDPIPIGVTLSQTGLLSGTFDQQYLGKRLTLRVTASDSAEIDTRTFTFAPATATGSNEIQFVHPLPGAHVSSPFGPRRPPTTGASSMHGGADFSLKPLPPGDVLAAADGQVTFVGFQAGGAGNYVKIKHLSGAGRELCTSVYMHLASFYVASGQQVVAGQKIGKEGNTGIGTGVHLHFECRLPDGTKIDPVPLIRGTVQVARETNPDNTAKDGTLEAQTGNAVLTQESVEARMDACPPFGPEYPADPAGTSDPVPSAPITDPFERAWYFTMTVEVGPAWTTGSPSDPEVAAGLIDTGAQRKKVGYVNAPGFPGGETKFGVAQGPNPSVNVQTIPYDPAKQVGFNNYWRQGSAALAGTKPKTAIMLFDVNYLHGNGNGKHILATAGIDALDDAASAAALTTAREAFINGIVVKNPNRQKYLAGWLKRARASLAYVQGLS